MENNKIIEIYLNNKKTVVIIAIICIVVIGIVFVKSKNNDGDDNYILEENTGLVSDNNTNKQTGKEDAINNENIFIHVSGEVYNPGIVILEENSRIIDVIEAAGGITVNADISNVNLAFAVSDGMKIHIPNFNEVKDLQAEYIISDGGKNVIVDNGEGTINGKGGKASKVNINTANETELVSLTGIGPSTANKIIEYREKNGKFKSIEELTNVNGIGSSKYEAISNLICVK